jgi:hypothetical protein
VCVLIFLIFHLILNLEPAFADNLQYSSLINFSVLPVQYEPLMSKYNVITYHCIYFYMPAPVVYSKFLVGESIALLGGTDYVQRII